MKKIALITLFLCSLSAYSQTAEKCFEKILKYEKDEILDSISMDSKGILTYRVTDDEGESVFFRIPMQSVTFDKHNEDPKAAEQEKADRFVVVTCPGDQQCISMTNNDGMTISFNVDYISFNTQARRNIALTAFKRLQKIAQGEK